MCSQNERIHLRLVKLLYKQEIIIHAMISKSSNLMISFKGEEISYSLKG